MSEAEIAAVAEAVHAQGRRMNAHCRSAESIKRCIRQSVRIIYHATFADEEALDVLEAKPLFNRMEHSRYRSGNRGRGEIICQDEGGRGAAGGHWPDISFHPITGT